VFTIYCQTIKRTDKIPHVSPDVIAPNGREGFYKQAFIII